MKQSQAQCLSASLQPPHGVRVRVDTTLGRMQIRERILHQRADLMRPNVLWLARGFLVLAQGATGQVDLPGPVQRGLDALRQGHYDDVGKEWAGSWTTANATGSPQQVTSSFKTFGAVAGPLVGYDVVKVLDVTPHIKRVYIALLYKTQTRPSLRISCSWCIVLAMSPWSQRSTGIRTPTKSFPQVWFRYSGRAVAANENAEFCDSVVHCARCLPCLNLSGSAALSPQTSIWRQRCDCRNRTHCPRNVVVRGPV